MSGVKSDVIATLLLNPGCEECQSLIARVFPGKAAQELIQSADAVTVQTELDLEMKRIVEQYSIKSNTAYDTDSIPQTLSRHLAGIDLKIAEPKSKLESEPVNLSPASHLEVVQSPSEAESKSAIKKSSSRQSSSTTPKSLTRSMFDPSFIDKSKAKGVEFGQLGDEQAEEKDGCGQDVGDEESEPCKLCTMR